jgi:hypothetical protein
MIEGLADCLGIDGGSRGGLMEDLEEELMESTGGIEV